MSQPKKAVVFKSTFSKGDLNFDDATTNKNVTAYKFKGKRQGDWTIEFELDMETGKLTIVEDTSARAEEAY